MSDGVVLTAGGSGMPAMHAERGGEAVHLDLGAALLSKASVSEQDNNAYVLTCRASGRQLLVDAADETASVMALVASAAAAAGRGLHDVRAVVTTHGHWDHHRALADVVVATGAPCLAGREDAGDLPVACDRLLDGGDTVQVGELSLQVVHLRGHTPGSVALVLPGEGDRPGAVLTGDSLFPGGVGNTWQDPARFTSLLDDVEARLFDVLGDDTVVAPGHGDGTSLGAERPSLPVWRARGW